MHPNRIGRRVVDCTDMYWAADRIGRPVTGSGKPSVPKPRRFPENDVLAHGPGLLPAGLTGKRQGGERGHMGPWPQPRGQGPLWDFLLKEAARRHDSGLLKFRTPTEIQVPLLAAASMARISSYADIPGVGRAADAVEVGSRPWFRFCPAPLLPVRDVGTWAGSIDAVTSGTPRAADGGTGTPVAPPPSAPVVLAFFCFGFLTEFAPLEGRLSPSCHRLRHWDE